MKLSLPRLTKNARLSIRIVCGLGGVCLLVLSLFLILRLPEGAAEARAVLALLAGLEMALAMALLQREGCSLPPLVPLLPLGVVFLLRVVCLAYPAPAFSGAIMPWVESLRDNGLLPTIAASGPAFPAPYAYLLSLLALLPLPELYTVKLIAILFDLLIAWAGMRIVRALRPQTLLPEGAFFCILLLPAQIMNSALLVQNSGIWAAFLLLAVAELFEEHPRRAVALAAVAFAFHLQALLFLPVFLMFRIVRRCKLSQLLYFPTVWILVLLPALLAGQTPGSIAAVYAGQLSGLLDAGTASSFSAFFGGGGMGWSIFGTALAVIAVLAVLYLLVSFHRSLYSGILLLAFALTALAVPFLLPGTKPGGFYCAEVVCVILACSYPGLAPIPCALQVAGLNAYSAVVLGKCLFPLPVGAALVLLCLAALGAGFWRALRSVPTDDEAEDDLPFPLLQQLQKRLRRK